MSRVEGEVYILVVLFGGCSRDEKRNVGVGVINMGQMRDFFLVFRSQVFLERCGCIQVFLLGFFFVVFLQCFLLSRCSQCFLLWWEGCRVIIVLGILVVFKWERLVYFFQRFLCCFGDGFLFFICGVELVLFVVQFYGDVVFVVFSQGQGWFVKNNVVLFVVNQCSLKYFLRLCICVVFIQQFGGCLGRCEYVVLLFLCVLECQIFVRVVGVVRSGKVFVMFWF